MQYKFVGEAEVHLPKFGLLVKPGEIVNSDRPIDHPDFQLIEAEKEEKSKKAK